MLLSIHSRCCELKIEFRSSLFAKKHLEDSQTKRNKIPWCDETKIQVFVVNSRPHVWKITRLIPSGCGDVFQRQDLRKYNIQRHPGGEAAPGSSLAQTEAGSSFSSSTTPEHTAKTGQLDEGPTRTQSEHPCRDLKMAVHRRFPSRLGGAGEVPHTGLGQTGQESVCQACEFFQRCFGKRLNKGLEHLPASDSYFE